jgi:hypothetical protein
MPVLKRYENPVTGDVIYQLADGTEHRLKAADVRLSGVSEAELLRRRGVKVEGRVPVRRHGRQIGTVPASFNPRNISSTSFLYDPRPGDFQFEDGGWTASGTLGPGDLDAIPGFVWDRDGRSAT